MLKQSLIAIAVIFIAWSVLDMVIHGMLLKSTYEETAHLWRPMEEMKMSLMYIVLLINSVCFVAIYSVFINEKSLMTGIKYSLLFGLAAGASMGYGSYSYMPIPYLLAFTWFAGMLIECLVAGIIVGTLVKRDS